MLDIRDRNPMERISNLSPRRREALKLLAEGCSDQEIAARMNLNSSTIISYTSANYSILGLTTLPSMTAKRSAAMQLYK